MFGVLPAREVIGISGKQLFRFFIELSFIFLLQDVLIASLEGMDG